MKAKESSMQDRPVTRFAAAAVGLLLVGSIGAAWGQSPHFIERETTASIPDATDDLVDDLVSLIQEPFTFRAPLDPYRILQLPEFMMRSTVQSDIVFQRLVFQPGVGGWHTHPGPSFVYVIEGEIKLDRFTTKLGCTETPVFGPGDAYFEVANEVHRAVVVSAESAVLLVTRFNMPVDGPLSDPADDPGC
jgi:hypothetical protein